MQWNCPYNLDRLDVSELFSSVWYVFKIQIVQSQWFIIPLTNQVNFWLWNTKCGWINLAAGLFLTPNFFCICDGNNNKWPTSRILASGSVRWGKFVRMCIFIYLALYIIIVYECVTTILKRWFPHSKLSVPPSYGNWLAHPVPQA